MRRENTFRIDFSGFPVKPTFEKVHGFCRQVLGLKKEDVLRLQCHRGENCAFVKVADLTLAQKVVDEHDGQHEVVLGGKKNKLRITMEDGSVEVKVHDLPESVSEEKIMEFLSAYGDVLSLQELTWGENFDFGGVPLGIWSARMIVRQNIDSWVTIDSQQAYIVYKGQLFSCKHCKEQAHTGISCVQNKKLLVQKSYANVAKQTGQRQSQKPSANANKPILVDKESTEPPALTPDDYPALPSSSSQNEHFGQSSQANTHSATTTQSTQHSHGSSSSFLAPPENTTPATSSFASVEPFKTPAIVTRSQSKNNNGNETGNETDESSTSTSSKKSKKKGPPGKRFRSDDSNDDQNAAQKL